MNADENMFTYPNYLKAKDSITFQVVEEIYNEILTEANTTKREFIELWTATLKAAIEYSNMRAKYSVQTPSERCEAFDVSRTAKHNTFMFCLEDIAFHMKEHYLKTDWFDKLGTIKNDRKRLGDFACYLVFINSLNAR